MKKINNILKTVALFAVIVASLTACKVDEIDVYTARRALFFPKLHPDGSKKVIDSVFVSFSHYPGTDELEIPFRVSLIGTIPDTDLPYSVSVVEARTTALKGDYTLPVAPVFRKGMAHDTLWVKVKRANLGEREVLLVLSINENENFEVGYFNSKLARLAFNDIKSQPTWWDKAITNTYFGTYSYEKYEAIVLAMQEQGITFTSTVGMEPTEIREIALIAKDYIAKKGLTEKDGSPMVIVAY